MNAASYVLSVVYALCAPDAVTDAVQPADRPPVLGMIVPVPADQLTPEHWAQLQRLNTVPELLLNPVAESKGAPFDFGAFRKDLDTFAAHGIPQVAVTITPHIRTIPWQPQVDERGQENADRHNPFDPAFIEEWTRLHREFAQAFADDERVGCVYVAPPSYFGEIEYYMSRDWTDLHWLQYGALAREQFAEWLRQRYDDPGDYARDWGSRVDEAIETLPSPTEGDRNPAHWPLFTRWRMEYLARLVSDQVHVLAKHWSREIGLKFSVGDFSAVHGTNMGLIGSLCSDVPNLAMHDTNGHSIADQRHAASIARRYGNGWVTLENDGDRFTRTEIAKITLVALMSGADRFNFAWHAHLVHSAPGLRPSGSADALASARTILEQYRTDPPRSPIAFLQSNTTTAQMRGADANYSLHLVYDRALVNAAVPQDGYNWARWLNYPDVTGEQLILDGDLEGRKLMVFPAIHQPVLPKAVWERIEAWVREGGTLVLFALPELLLDRPIDGSITEKLPWQFPASDLQAGLPEPWSAVAIGDPDDAAAAEMPLGSGAIVAIRTDMVQWDYSTVRDPYHQDVVPRVLRGLAERAGVEPPVTVRDPKTGLMVECPIALAYVGRRDGNGPHLFVGGAYDGSLPSVELEWALDGPVEIVLVDLDRVAAESLSGAAVAVTLNRSSQAEIYRDPSNQERANAFWPSAPVIPVTTITVAPGADAAQPQRLLLKLAPEP